MGAFPVRRLLVAGIAVAVGATGAPALAVTSGPAFEPVFAQSAFTIGADELTFPALANRSFHELKYPKTAEVEFTQAIKLFRNRRQLQGQCVPGGACKENAATSYFEASDGTKYNATDEAVDSSDDKRLVLTAPSGMPDGRYKLHVTAFAKDSCPDVAIQNEPPLGTPPACTTYDGYVNNGAQPFTFRIDTTGPVTTLDALPTLIDASTAKTVSLHGKTSYDTKTVTITVKSSGGGAPLVFTVNQPPESGGEVPQAWNRTVDLAGRPDGTLTISVVGTDFAGNDGGKATGTTVLHAHASAPRNVTAHPGDTTATLTWDKPTDTGGKPITGYDITATDQTDEAVLPVTKHSTCTSSHCSFVFTGLVNGDTFLFRVAAVTSIGRGASDAAAAQPRGISRLTVRTTKPAVNFGDKLYLTGRLLSPKTGAGVKHATLTITAKDADGNVGKPFTVTTDIFGIFNTPIPTVHKTTYTVKYAGSPAAAAATASTMSHVRSVVTQKVVAGRGGTAVVTGRLRPNLSGRLVWVHYRFAHQKRTSVRYAKVRSDGTFHQTLRLHRHPSVVIYSVMPGNKYNDRSLQTRHVTIKR